MANVKEYAFYVEGRKLCIVERDTQFDNDVNSKDYGPGVHRTQWKSPKSTVADGIQLQYSHTPDYFINETEDVDTQIDTYVSTGGLLKIIDQGDNDYTLAPESLSDGSYVVLKKAGKFNGLHKVKAAGTGYITFYTKYSGSATVQQAFEESVELYYNVDALDNEEDELPIPSYLEKALVYYVKAKLAEDKGELDLKEYFMREYKKITEKYDSSLKAGARITATPGPYAIR